jgi:hypothetical protein
MLTSCWPHADLMQVPTSDTKRMSSGLEPRQVSMDVGKAQGGGFGRVSTPAPAFPEDTEVARANGRPSMWSPAAPTSDNLQRRIDAVTRQIAEKQTEVPYNGMLGVNPFNQRRAFLGDPGYARDGLPYCRKTGTPQPDPLKYVWNSRPCNQAPAPAPANPSESPL